MSILHYHLSIILLLNSARAPDDTIGLNIRLYNEIDIVVRRLFSSQITISKASTNRAIYFHGYLLEQTLKIFDVTSMELLIPKQNHITAAEIKQLLMRQILMLPRIIITKENLYSMNGKDIIIYIQTRFDLSKEKKKRSFSF